GHGKPPGLIGKHLYTLIRDIELPGLRIMARWSQDSIIEEEGQPFLSTRIVLGKFALIDVPDLQRRLWLHKDPRQQHSQEEKYA
ncbi:MAG: hypothetical protein LUQ08_03760, partial [Methanothrix sp.]|nr:hypothetical protein [Methanothrix sp.]